MTSLDHQDLVKLAAWIRRMHAGGKHVIVLLDTYDPESVTKQIRAHFPQHTTAGSVDTILGTMWVSVRPLLDRVPSALRTNTSVAICTITP